LIDTLISPTNLISLAGFNKYIFLNLVAAYFFGPPSVYAYVIARSNSNQLCTVFAARGRINCN